MAEPKSNNQREFEMRSKQVNNIIQVFEGGQTHIFRVLALALIILVEIALFTSIFLDKEGSGETLIAITVISVLPILVIRVFDLSTLNLNKDGLVAEMAKKTVEASAKNDPFYLPISKSNYDLLSSFSTEETDPGEHVELNETLIKKLDFLENVGYINSIKPLLHDQIVPIDLQSYYTISDVGIAVLRLSPKYSNP